MEKDGGIILDDRTDSFVPKFGNKTRKISEQYDEYCRNNPLPSEKVDEAKAEKEMKSAKDIIDELFKVNGIKECDPIDPKTMTFEELARLRFIGLDKDEEIAMEKELKKRGLW